MKYNKKYLFAACAALLLGMQSCDLEEYNPAGSTPDNVYKEQAGFEALVNSAYAFWGGQFYGREDFVFTPNFSTELSSFAGYFLRGLFTLSATSSTGILSFFPQFRL